MTDSVLGSSQKRISLVAKNIWRVGKPGITLGFTGMEYSHKYNTILPPTIKGYNIDKLNWRYLIFYKSDKFQVRVTHWKTQSSCTYHTTGELFTHNAIPINQ